MLGDEDGDVVGDAECDRIGGSGIDSNLLAIVNDHESGEEGTGLKIVDLDSFEATTQRGQDRRQKIVGLRASDVDALEPAFDGEGLGKTDDDWKASSPLKLGELDDLDVSLTDDRTGVDEPAPAPAEPSPREDADDDLADLSLEDDDTEAATPPSP